MPGPKRPRSYFVARREINVHLFRRHGGQMGGGTLADKLDHHERLHLEAKQKGIETGHVHEDYPTGECDEEAARRLFLEGEGEA
jgi:hypothetical protein